MNINKNIIAAVAYFTWIGFLAAYMMGDKTDPFMRHHLNQALVIDLIGLMGAVSAYQGSRASLPFIGDIHIIG